MDVVDGLQGVAKLLLIDAVDDERLLVVLKLSCKVEAVVVEAAVGL